MGANKSKIDASEEIEKHEELSIPSTPILTPKGSRENIEKEHLDPRSPSRHISRTPIDLLSAVAEKLEMLTTKENKSLVLTPLKTHMFLGIDPRSPTLDIQRTPIVVSVSPDKKLPEKIRNKNLDKVRKVALLDTPKRHVPPKLLDSTPVMPKPKLDESKRKSFVGLLETNIDFTETDLDTVLKEKYLGNDAANDSYSTITDPRSPSTDFVRTPLQIMKSVEKNIDKVVSQESLAITDIVQNEKEENCSSELQEELQQTKVMKESDDNEQILKTNQIEEYRILFKTELKAENANICDNADKQTAKYCVELIEQIVTCVTVDDTVSNSIKSAPITPPNSLKISPKPPPIIDLTADAKELDKKLTNLIYEDDDLVVCPRVVKIKEQNRTPLGIRNGNNDKSTRKLKVSDKPRKSETALSKIPIFKEKKIKVQCENTPPRGMKNGKTKRTQWDTKDETMII